MVLLTLAVSRRSTCGCCAAALYRLRRSPRRGTHAATACCVSCNNMNKYMPPFLPIWMPPLCVFVTSSLCSYLSLSILPLLYLLLLSIPFSACKRRLVLLEAGGMRHLRAYLVDDFWRLPVLFALTASGWRSGMTTRDRGNLTCGIIGFFRAAVSAGAVLSRLGAGGLSTNIPERGTGWAAAGGWEAWKINDVADCRSLLRWWRCRGSRRRRRANGGLSSATAARLAQRNRGETISPATRSGSRAGATTNSRFGGGGSTAAWRYCSHACACCICARLLALSLSRLSDGASILRVSAPTLTAAHWAG